MNKPVNAAPGIFQRCPHLGLHDDRSTSLAYPSAWNCCYRATPPESVSTAHQESVCLTVAHMQCPILLRAGQQGPLPDNLRGDADVIPHVSRPPRSRAGMVITLLVLIAAGGYLLWSYLPLASLQAVVASPTPPAPTETLAPTETSTPTKELVINPAEGIIASFTAEAKTRIANYTPTPLFTGTPPTATITSTITATFTPTRTFTPTKTPSITLTPPPSTTPTFAPPPADGPNCGASLDTPFGGATKFILHKILPGENLTIYADTYQTTTNAIMAVNYRLPLPVWADWIVVIPYKTDVVNTLPPFEPYQALNMRISIEELARQLGTDAASLATYNGFTEACGSFNGWLLIARPNP